jgi:hypothetical protein
MGRLVREATFIVGELTHKCAVEAVPRKYPHVLLVSLRDALGRWDVNEFEDCKVM